MKPTMTDGKDSGLSSVVESPTYIVTPAASEKKSRITRKHLLIGGIVVVVVVVILVAILVGMYMFTQAQKDIVKFSMTFKGANNENVKQDVESDPNDNVVMYHVTKAGQDAYIVNDFNRGMQIVKISAEDRVECYVTALNKSAAADSSVITDADSMKGSGTTQPASYHISKDPVSDRSFLPKKARDLCKDVGVYWVTKDCDKQVNDKPTTGLNNTDSNGGRSKRTIYYAGYYCSLPGLGGCCYDLYACYVRLTQYYDSYGYHCYFYYETGTCCSSSPCCNYAYYRYNSYHCY